MGKSPSSQLSETAGFLGGQIKQVRLGWRLLRDSRVPGWLKMIPVAGLFYFLSPIDLIPDWALPGLGEVDDLVVLMLALRMIVDLSPPHVVQEHLERIVGIQGGIGSASEPPPETYVDATYRVHDQDGS